MTVDKVRQSMTKIISSENYKRKIPLRPSLRLSDCIKIPLGSNAKDGYATISLEDEWLTNFNWSLSTAGYPVTSYQGTKYMHRLIIDGGKGLHTDHINRNKLDNRRENLRICKPHENLSNRTMQKNNSQGMKGVYYDERRGKYYSRIQSQGRDYFLGTFATKQAAADAYKKKAKELHGEYVCL